MYGLGGSDTFDTPVAGGAGGVGGAGGGARSTNFDSTNASVGMYWRKNKNDNVCIGLYWCLFWSAYGVLGSYWCTYWRQFWHVLKKQACIWSVFARIIISYIHWQIPTQYMPIHAGMYRHKF